MGLPRLNSPAIRTPETSAGCQPRQIALRVFDADLLAEAVRDAGLEHRQLHPGPFHGELIHTEVGGLSIDGGCYSQTLLARGDFSPSRITIGIPLSDREPGYINGILARAHDLVVFPEGGELDYVLPAGTAWGTVQLERDTLEQLGVPKESIGQMSVASPQVGQHGRLVRLVRSALDGHVRPHEQHAFREALLEALYQALDPRRRQDRRASFYDRADLVRRFERLVDKMSAERHSIAELAQALGVARRTLEQAFRDYVGLSPARYVAMLRLNAMRRELLSACEDNLRVAELAERHGIVHLGRFAGDYRRMFGELPSHTLRRRAPTPAWTDAAVGGLAAGRSVRALQPR